MALALERIEVRVGDDLPARPRLLEDAEPRRRTRRVRLAVDETLDRRVVAGDERRAGPRCSEVRDPELPNGREALEVCRLAGARAVRTLDLKCRREERPEPGDIAVLNQLEELHDERPGSLCGRCCGARARSRCPRDGEDGEERRGSKVAHGGSLPLLR